jgi:hypothetical protein
MYPLVQAPTGADNPELPNTVAQEVNVVELSGGDRVKVVGLGVVATVYVVP